MTFRVLVWPLYHTLVLNREQTTPTWGRLNPVWVCQLADPDRPRARGEDPKQTRRNVRQPPTLLPGIGKRKTTARADVRASARVLGNSTENRPPDRR